MFTLSLCCIMKQKEQLFVFLFGFPLNRGQSSVKRKILKVDELPKGFYYFTEEYMIEGTGKKCVKEQKHEGLRKKKRK